MLGLVAMQRLEHDHAAGLVIVERLEALLQQGDAAALQQAVQLLQAYTPEMEAHLQQEEQSVLRPLVQYHREHLALCIQIGREHGTLRTLAETVSLANATQIVVEFAQLLRAHTLLEDAQLFPLVADLFNAEQLQAIADFVPLAAITPPASSEAAIHHNLDQLHVWVNVLRAHLHRQPDNGVHFVLLPRYAPEFVQLASQKLGLPLFDYQQAVMADYREQAEFIALTHMTDTLQTLAQQQAFIFHNAEALLCVKPEAERRAWLADCRGLVLPYQVLIPLTLYQAEIPETDRAITIHG